MHGPNFHVDLQSTRFVHRRRPANGLNCAQLWLLTTTKSRPQPKFPLVIRNPYPRDDDRNENLAPGIPEVGGHGMRRGARDKCRTKSGLSGATRCLVWLGSTQTWGHAQRQWTCTWGCGCCRLQRGSCPRHLAPAPCTCSIPNPVPTPFRQLLYPRQVRTNDPQ